MAMNDNKVENDSQDELLGQLASEFSDRCMAGESPSIEEYAVRYPQIADVIRDLFPALLALQQDLEIDRVPSPLSGRSALGEFTIVREIGRGGMGIVCEAIQRSMHRAVALKILPFAAFADSRRLKRFQNEVRAVATLDHPHIVAIHSVGEEDGIHFYSMQLVRGASLSQVLDRLREALRTSSAGLNDRSIVEAVSSWTRTNSKRSGSDGAEQVAPTPIRSSSTVEADDRGENREQSSAELRPLDARRREGQRVQPSPESVPWTSNYCEYGYFRTVAQLAADVAGALEHAHQHGIVHRDIKPANLLISQQGKVRVTDFGVARISDDTTLSSTSELVGTLRYMAPEQALGKGAVDHRADIYSLGATLYEMLTLQPVFTTEDRLELLQQIAHQEPKRPRAIEPGIPVDLQTISLKALSKDPADRYTSAHEMRQDLHRFLEHRPILARPPGLLDHLVKGVWRHPWTSAVILLFLVSLTTFSLMMTRAARKAEQSLETTTQVLYASDMRTASQVLAAGEMYRALELLKRYEPQPGERDRRDFVWHYLNRRLDRNEKVISTRAWGPARWIESSPDGQSFATGHESGAVVLWQSHSWKVIAHLKEHRETVTRVMFLQDRRRLVSADESGLICVWDLEARRLLAKLQCPGERYDGLAVSPDGTTIVVGADRKILFWNGLDREPFRTIEVHLDRIMALEISADGKTLASVDRSNHLRIWSLPECELRQFENYDRGNSLFVTLAFLPDSRRLLIGSQRGDVTVYHLDEKKLGIWYPIHKSNVYSMKLSADGKSLLTASKDMTVKLTDVTDPEGPSMILQHSRRAYCAIFTEEDHVVSTSRDDTIRIWPRVSTSHEIHQLMDHHGASSLDARGDRFVASNFAGAGRYGSTRGHSLGVLPVVTHSPQVLWAHHPHRAIMLGSEMIDRMGVMRHKDRRSLDFDIDGDGDLDLVASLGSRGMLLVQKRLGEEWDVPRLSHDSYRSGWRHVNVPGASSDLPCVWFILTSGQFFVSRGGRLDMDITDLAYPVGMDAADLDQDGATDLVLATALDSTVSWYSHVDALRLNNRRVVTQSIQNVKDVLAFDVDEDNLLDVVVATPDGLYWCRHRADHEYEAPVRLGPVMSGEMASETLRVDTLDIHADGHAELVIASAAGIVIFTRQGEGAWNASQPVQDLRTADWLPPLPSHAVVWNVESQTIDHHFHLPLLSVRATALTRDDQFLATASAEKMVSIWRLATGEPHGTIPTLENGVSSLEWSRDGRTLFIATGDEVHVWDRLSRRMKQVLRVHENTVSDIAVSHDGSRLATISHDLTVRLWQMGDEKPGRMLLGHKEHPQAAAFSPDDRILATLERTGTVYLWHVETGQLMLTLDDFQVEDAHDVRFSDDRTLVVTGETSSIQSCIWHAHRD